MNIWHQFVERITRGANRVLDALEQLWHLIAALPALFVSYMWQIATSAAVWIAALFPDSAGGMGGVVDQADTALGTFSQYMILANYVINLPALGAALVFFLAIEAVTLVIRLYKFVLTMIPVAR